MITGVDGASPQIFPPPNGGVHSGSGRGTLRFVIGHNPWLRERGLIPGARLDAFQAGASLRNWFLRGNDPDGQAQLQRAAKGGYAFSRHIPEILANQVDQVTVVEAFMLRAGDAI